ALLQEVDDAQPLAVLREAAEVAETGPPAAVEASGEEVVESARAGGTEGGLAEGVAERDGFDQVLVQAGGAAERSGDLRHLERVGQPVPAVILVGGEDAVDRLLAEPAEGARVDDAVAVALVGGAVVERPALVPGREAPGG